MYTSRGQVKEKKKVKRRILYNQVARLAQDTLWESEKSIRKHHIHVLESQEVILFPADDHKAARNRQDSITKSNMKYR